MAANTGTKIDSLETTTEKEIVKCLGRLAENITISSMISCGGELSFPDKVQLLYKSKSHELHEIVFPNASDVDIQQLKDACSVASFGLGDQQVTDTSYRDALKLDPDNFATSFQVSNTPILFETAMTMVHVHCIQAELYKLNIYAAGSFFKAHVDTPRSHQMFGSLVVCLPTQFSGGALVIRHHGHEVKFDWSSPPDSPRKTVSWATFFSDVEHEVLPVTQGHRITLTYNLYRMDRQLGSYQLPACDVTTNPLYGELRAVLDNPIFMRGGGVLGFASFHTYVFTELNATESLPILLKGADRIIYFIARSLGLAVMVKPITYSDSSLFLMPKFVRFGVRDYYKADEDDQESIADTFDLTPHQDKYITWCKKLGPKQPAGVTMTYGNEPGLDVYYQAAAILVGIPEWGEFRRNCTSGIVQKTPESESTEVGQQQTSEADKKPAKRSQQEEDDSAAILKKLCFHGEEFH